MGALKYDPSPFQLVFEFVDINVISKKVVGHVVPFLNNPNEERIFERRISCIF